MGDLKPLGSEKLNSDEKLKRILELTYYKQNNNKSSIKPELVKEAKNGTVYGIVKEKDGYYVKKGLNEQSLDYIGGMFMKNKNRFSSYAEALKRLELLRGQELIGEATKYVLKKKTEENPTEPVGGPEASPEMPPPPAPEGEKATGGELPPSPEGGEPTPDLSGLEIPGETPASPEAEVAPEGAPSDEKPEGGESKRSDYMAEVQKYAGKLGQELRDQKERMESDDIKYVLNMIISAVDLEKLELEDLEEIGKKFDREESEESSEEVPSEEPSSDETPEAPEGTETEMSPEEELGEESFGGMNGLEEFIKSPVSTKEIDLSKYAMKEGDTMEGEKTVELDMDEIKKQINQSVSEILGKHFK